MRQSGVMRRAGGVAPIGVDATGPARAPGGAVGRERRVSAPEGSERMRRLANVAASIVGLVLFAVPMLVIAVLVKLTSRGPVFYTQERIGLDRRRRARPVARDARQVDLGGKPFRLYKFRTMYVNADRSGQVWATPDDPRVTPLGRVLRRCRLDELPQLINVLKGDMNVVGPRPEQPRIFAELSCRVARYVDRQRVLPGITGLAQVSHHYDRTLDDVERKVSYDLEYLARRSVREDLRIMARTVPVMLGRRGGW
ncbi:MAG TPA: sugar transferase [Longimicrobiales bacterium]